jgi:hypothetical protein
MSQPAYFILWVFKDKLNTLVDEYTSDEIDAVIPFCKQFNHQLIYPLIASSNGTYEIYKEET